MKTWCSWMVCGFVLVGCADVKNDVDVDGSGGAASGGSTAGGGSTASGGVLGSGNSSSSGGAATGGASTGGAATGGASTGGASTGGAASGGSATGGAATGGAGTGGAPVITTGDCAGKPTLTAWLADSAKAVGDEVVIQCSVSQAACNGKDLNVNILWKCVGGGSAHLGNCTSQTPQGSDGTWTYLQNCSE